MSELNLDMLDFFCSKETSKFVGAFNSVSRKEDVRRSVDIQAFLTSALDENGQFDAPAALL
jgi:hypothetical protein